MDCCIRDRILGGLFKVFKKLNFRDCVFYRNYKLCFKFLEFEKFFLRVIDGIIKCIEDILILKECDDVLDIVMVGWFLDCFII